MYSYTPALDPATGDWAPSAAERAPMSPATQVVLWTLRTPLGSYAPDPTLGPDLDVPRRSTDANVQANWRSEVERTLGRYTRRGTITELLVTVDRPAGGVLRYAVEFKDPRAATLTKTRLDLVVRR